MFYFARCMNIIFNSLLAQLVKYDDRVRIQFPVPDIYLGMSTSHPGQLGLAIPSWVGAISTIQRAVTPCVEVRMVRVWD